MITISVVLGSCAGKEDNGTGGQIIQSVYSNYGHSILSSSDFLNNTAIPARFTCDEEDVSPELSWLSRPEGTASYALICEDPDAIGGTWVHWIIFNIPSSFTSIEENIQHQDQFDNGILQGINDFGEIGGTTTDRVHLRVLIIITTSCFILLIVFSMLQLG